MGGPTLGESPHRVSCIFEVLAKQKEMLLLNVVYSGNVPNKLIHVHKVVQLFLDNHNIVVINIKWIFVVYIGSFC